MDTLIIAPITSTSKPYPTRIEITGSNTKGWVMIDQIRTIDKRRVLKVFPPISPDEVAQVKAIIKQTFVD